MVAETEKSQTSPDSKNIAPDAVNAVDELTEPAQDAAGKQPDGSSFDIPRPFLTLEQAAAILGKSLRALERSILGRWGNKLPDGWAARKIPTEKGTEWRILPPPGFRLRQVHNAEEDGQTEYGADSTDEPLASLTGSERRKAAWPQSLDRHAIIIDRSEEVEYLLRELVQSQKQLSEERRLRMEDLRLITQMQGSMRLLETRANETSKLKDEFSTAQQELKLLKDQYLELLHQPWWKRIFRRRPQ